MPLAFVIVCCSIRQAAPGDAQIAAVEFFAGKKSVTNGMRAFNMLVADYEIKDHRTLIDILGALGFLFATRLTLAVQEHGLVWLAPVCSMWVWCCRWSSGRTPERPLGLPTKCVLAGNIMVARCMLLAVLAQVSGAVATLEQPISSSMPRHPAFAWFTEVSLKLHRHGGRPFLKYHTWLGMFGGRRLSRPLCFPQAATRLTSARTCRVRNCFRGPPPYPDNTWTKKARNG